MPFVRVSAGTNLHYQEYGSGPPLLLMDGVGGSWVWYKNLPELSKHFRIINLDTLGTGLSDKPYGPYTIPQLATQLIEVIQQLGIAPTHCIGLSQGGQIALEAAVQRPELFNRIITIGTMPGGEAQVLPTNEMRLRCMPGMHLSETQNFLKVISSVLSPTYMATHPKELAEAQQFVRAQPSPIYVRIAWTYAAATWQGIGGRAEPLRGRVLVMNGELDEESRLPNAVILATQLPDCEAQIYRGTGHLIELEHPEHFNQGVIKFLLQKQPAGK